SLVRHHFVVTPSPTSGRRSALECCEHPPMDELVQHGLNALILGGTYALLGIGLTLIFGIMRVVNFTHGELYSFGAYAVYLVTAFFGLNFFLALIVAIIAGC